MGSYNEFAYIYDRLIDQDYDKWASYIIGIFNKNNCNPNLVLDLACGTGSLSCVMAEKGYDMIAVDSSVDMLAVAAEKAAEKKLDIRFLHQDMTCFELYGTVDAVICTLDAVNYLSGIDQMEKTFKLVNNYLNPGGIFIFDINTKYKLKHILGDNSFIYDTGNIFYTWENQYNEPFSTQYFTFFVEENGAYYRIDETHCQRAFKTVEVTGTLRKSGFGSIQKYKLFSFEPPGRQCERFVFVAKSFC